jgi:high-affinity nickel-transport protein
MSHAYGWAFSSPVRKVYYNISVTSLSVAVAWMVGAIELLQVFAATWLCSIALWKTRRYEQRWSALLERT